MESILIEKSKLLNVAITKFIADGAKSYHEYEINCSDLNERFITEDIRCSTEYEKMFLDLKEIESNPCIYYFEILSDIEPETIVKSIKNINDLTEKQRKIIPAIKSNYPRSSNVLYIGKVNSCFWGRLITHLGFHTHKNGGNTPAASGNHGLQLYLWAGDLSLRLKVIEFEPEMKDLMPVLEKELARRLSPIIGKHL